MPFVNGIKAAREQIVTRTDEDRSDFLRRRGFYKGETAKMGSMTKCGTPCSLKRLVRLALIHAIQV